MYSGFLNILKPPGMTSHDLVALLRRVLRQKKIGHSGTLDPNASGVMVVALGSATRLLEYLDTGVKEYIGLVRLGIDTDTYDSDGVITAQFPDATFSWDQLQEVADSLVGSQLQKPPMISAVRISGKRLYEYARTGTEVELPLRKVDIHELVIAPLHDKAYLGFADLVKLRVRCSKGTYVRSIAFDLGHGVGSGAHLATLLRTESDGFNIADTLTIEEVCQLVADNQLSRHIIAAVQALPFKQIQLDPQTVKRVAHGNSIDSPVIVDPDDLFSLVYAGKLIAVARYHLESDKGYLQPVKVLSNELYL